jgi:helix-turn-helix protein
MKKKTVKEANDVTIKKEDDEFEDIFEEKNSQLASPSSFFFYLFLT